MSDEEDFEASGDKFNFSDSEDEWKPNKEDSSDTDSDFQVAEEDDVTNKISNKLASSKRKKSSLLSKKRLSNGSLRARMFNRYKPPPRTVSSPQMDKNLSQILDSSKFQKRKQLQPSTSQSQDCYDSDSSGDDHLVDPEKLDLKSSFFDVQEKIDTAKTMAPMFDCNAGMHLTDSESDDGEDKETQGADDDGIKKASSTVLKINKKSTEQISFKHLHDYTKNLEDARQHLRNFKSDLFKEEAALDVNKILEMGESSIAAKSENSEGKKRKKPTNDSGSDWEDVEESKPAKVYKEGLQITVDLPSNVPKTKKEVDVEAMLKRKINRVIKEKQVYLHKVSTLVHLSYGIFCNRVLNTPALMKYALKLLPSKDSYPNGQTEIRYFEAMVKWYSVTMQIFENELYSSIKKRPPLGQSLILQMRAKTALCKRDYVLIFITLLRGMGIHCRMVLNLPVLPIKPAQSDLCSLKLKKNATESNSNTTKTNASGAKIDQNKTKENRDNKKTTETKKILHTRGNLEKKPKNEDMKNDLNNHPSCSNSNRQKEHSSSSSTKQNSQQNTQRKETSKTENPKQYDNADDNKVSNTRLRSRSKIKDQEKNSVNEFSIKNVRPAKKIDIQNNVEKKIVPASSRSKRAKTEPKEPVENTKNNLEDSNKRSSRTRSKHNEKLSAKIEKEKPKPSGSKTTTVPILSTNAVATKSTSNRNTRSKSKPNLQALSIPQLDGGDDVETNEGKSSKSNRPRKKQFRVPSENREPPTDSDEEFEPSPPKKPRVSRINNKRVLSTDDEKDEDTKKPNRKGMDVWVEVWCEKESKWVTIDLFKPKVDCVDNIRKAASSPITYVFAWDSTNTLKDVTPRYCPQFNTVTRKQRAEKEWLDEAIQTYKGTRNSRDTAEDREFQMMHLAQPMPSAINEYKNHPLYALGRHLLKFEAIYPPNAVTLGWVRGEAVYARDCVHTLHSREIWLKSARVVKLGEKPYKIVKARPKWDRVNSTVIKDLPLEIFGYWQTMEYDPPTAENGIVPRNAYGNVELFKKRMLPKKTVHLQLPGLNKVCKKLGIDCAPAVVGFDFHQGACHPMFDGFVICEEFAEKVVDGWNREQEESERRQEEKYNARVYGNWKKLIKGLLIRIKLKKRYNFDSKPK